ncbi:AAA family ATPase [Pseudobutyrivibrio ruminis]|uniref:AAA family ATPase n=1 Tax=Pseudobutyrivibrio ruminis TaxID=46206 RepID=UPI00051B3DFC|nr:AAA family ATPase [Pseudobutyrivibrio ruminis]
MKDFFSEIVGYENIKYELRIIIDMLKNTEKYKKMGAYMRNGILFIGPPGTGKTTMANCFASATGRKIFTIRKKYSDGRFLEEINTTFSEAVEAAPSIILLDDIDKFAVQEAHRGNEEEFVAVQACIDEVREKDVFVIATANDSRRIPDSLQRDGRLGKAIIFNVPQKSDRIAIIDHYLKRMNNVKDVDSESIARMLDGYSCAMLETIIKTAAMRAAYNNNEYILMDDFVEACLEEVFDIRGSDENLSEKTCIRTAYHEAGHALIAELVDPKSVSIVSIRKIDSHVQGFVRYSRIPESEYTYDYYENLIKVSLAGKAAVEVVLGETDLGTNRDLHNAFDRASKLVDNYCSYGFHNWIEDGNGDFVAENRNREMIAVMERNYMAVKKMLIENRELLDLLANALLEKTTLIYSDIQAIMYGEEVM